jgi:hypothetical protein
MHKSVECCFPPSRALYFGAPGRGACFALKPARRKHSRRHRNIIHLVGRLPLRCTSRTALPTHVRAAARMCISLRRQACVEMMIRTTGGTRLGFPNCTANTLNLARTICPRWCVLMCVRSDRNVSCR